MTKLGRMAQLQKDIKDQREWIDHCGGNLAGYVFHYEGKGVDPEAIFKADQRVLKDMLAVREGWREDVPR